MRSLQLQAALTELIQDAAAVLTAALAAGAEVRFELDSQGRSARSSVGGAPVLYSYRALTGEFIAERRGELERLGSYVRAGSLLESFHGLDRYLVSAGVERAHSSTRSRTDAALLALVQDTFEGQSDFELRPERLQAALDRLERSALESTGETTIVATLHGLTITSSEVALTRGLTIAQPHALDDLPEGAQAGEHQHLVVALNAGDGEPREAIARGRAVLKDLLRALRLFGDGRVTLGALAWARVSDGRWGALALGAGGRPYGMLVVTAEQEDELRAFCNLVSRRAPHGNALAWALRRFELGCERASSFEGLTDHLLALRVLLEPEGPASGQLPGRLAALCATPEERMALTERTLAALALEREVIAGAAATASSPKGEHVAAEQLARDVANHLRALLRDVICGHLDEDLVGLADQLLLADASAGGQDAPQGAEPVGGVGGAQSSVEQMLGDAAQSQEILDVFI